MHINSQMIYPHNIDTYQTEERSMDAIEFVSKIEKGKITVPKKYLTELTQNFRVIILVDKEKKQRKETKKRTFTAFKMKTKGLKIDREKANLR